MSYILAVLSLVVISMAQADTVSPILPGSYELPEGYEWLEVELTFNSNNGDTLELTDDQWLELQTLMGEEDFLNFIALFRELFGSEIDIPIDVVESRNLNSIGNADSLDLFEDAEYDSRNDSSYADMGASDEEHTTTPEWDVTEAHNIPAGSSRDGWTTVTSVIEWDGSSTVATHILATDRTDLPNQRSDSGSQGIYYSTPLWLLILLPAIAVLILVVLILLAVVRCQRKPRRSKQSYGFANSIYRFDKPRDEPKNLRVAFETDVFDEPMDDGRQPTV